jgi:glycosyltransferase involved in cell wall biosynthesis
MVRARPIGAGRMIDARHYLPGGLEQGGGIGRLVGHIVDAAAGDGVAHAVSDTRGPGWSPLRSPVRLLMSVAAMTRDRFAAPGRIHHIHVAGRGSTARKIALCAAARGLGCTHVLHLHDYDYATDFRRRPGWQQALVRRMFRGADHVLVLGRGDRDTAVDLLGVKAAQLTVLGNCVPDPGPRTPMPGDAPCIVFLGQLGPRKGVPELLRALASPQMQALPWRAVIAGDGPVATYRAEADGLGLGDRVTMPGWIDRAAARRLCAGADILVLPSHNEGMAMAVIEGLAHGLAVVTTRVGAHEEAIADGVTGVFVPVGDPDGLAAALARLVTDPAERARLSAAARAQYLARFSMEGYMRALGRVYAGLRAVGRPDAAAEERPT